MTSGHWRDARQPGRRVKSSPNCLSLMVSPHMHGPRTHQLVPTSDLPLPVCLSCLPLESGACDSACLPLVSAPDISSVRGFSPRAGCPSPRSWHPFAFFESITNAYCIRRRARSCLQSMLHTDTVYRIPIPSAHDGRGYQVSLQQCQKGYLQYTGRCCPGLAGHGWAGGSM